MAEEKDIVCLSMFAIFEIFSRKPQPQEKEDGWMEEA
jgi:hypothetical protein